MLSSFRLKIARFLLKKKLKNTHRKVRAIGLDKATEIGILYDATNRMEYESVKKLTNYLIEERKKVSTLGYINSKKGTEMMTPHLHFRYFDNNHLSKLFIPNNNEVESFLNSPFQILIDLTLSDSFPLEYIASLSKARFKVGATGNYRDEVCDLTISLKDNQSIDQLILQLKHYLKMINAA